MHSQKPSTVKQSHSYSVEKVKEEVVQEDKKRKKFKLEDLTVVSILGKGSFGEVTLVEHQPSGNHFALKQIRKERIRGQKHIQHI